MTAQPWLTGPIAITGGNGHVGCALRRRLTGLPNLVRVLGRGIHPEAIAHRFGVTLTHLTEGLVSSEKAIA